MQPKALVFVANAYFPSLLARAKRQGIRTLLINGVLSRNVDVGNKGLRRALALQVHRSLDAVAAQSEADAEAFLALGLPRDRVTVTGKLEGDLAALRLSPEARRALRLSLGLPDDAPVFMVGSLHPGEEPTVLEAFRRMRAALPQVRLVVAPRWLHDAPVMAERLQAQGYRVERRTALQQRPPTGPLAYDALLIDTFGELRTLYGAADAAFIGSSLVPINIRKGGHNILEPLAHDVPPLFGPHMNLWQDATIQLLAAWPGLAVDGPAALADRAVEVLTQRAPLDAVRRTGRSIIEQDSGALNRTLQFLDRWMETA